MSKNQISKSPLEVFFEIPLELANLPNISAKLKTNCGCQMVSHVSIIHGLCCLTFMIWPFILTALIVASCLYFASMRCCEKKQRLLLTHHWNDQHLRNTSMSPKRKTIIISNDTINEKCYTGAKSNLEGFLLPNSTLLEHFNPVKKPPENFMWVIS